MAALDWKSRKRLDASCQSKQPRDLVFFIDKCLGLKTVPDALRAIGEQVELKTDHFPQDAKDEDWVPVVGERGWIILSADAQLKHNYIEIVALLKASTHSFLLTRGDLAGSEMAQAFVKAMPHIKGIIASKPPPLVAIVYPSGKVRVTHTHEGLIEHSINVKEAEDRRRKKHGSP